MHCRQAVEAWKMKDMNKLLTIGIPVWNCEKELSHTLDSILSQLNAESRAQIEILISDNASTDGTPLVIEEYVKKNPSLISAHRNAKNIGFSGNVDGLFHLAHGEFVFYSQRG